jgi:hypothetical protein
MPSEEFASSSPCSRLGVLTRDIEGSILSKKEL